MANNLKVSFQEIWAKEQQEVFNKKNVAMQVADTSFKDSLKSGDTLNRTYRSDASIQTYTRGTDINIDDLTDTNEQLVVNKQYANGFYVDDFDAIQSKYDVAANYGKDYGVELSNQVDADVLYETVNAANTLDAWDFAGTAGNGLAVTTTNILSVFSKSRKTLKKENVDDSSLIAVISPDLEEIMINYGAGRDTDMGDSANENGYFGRFYGYDVYTSNQLTASAVLDLGTQPTAADTITIEGQTFTFVSTIGTTAGNVLIGGDVDATRANLAALINAPWTTTANGVALTGSNLNLFESKMVAVNDDTADTLTVFRKGWGTITVADSLTAAANGFDTDKTIQHNLFAVRGNPCLVMQRKPNIVFRAEPKKLGWNYLNGVLYGVKTFQDNSKKMVGVNVLATSF